MEDVTAINRKALTSLMDFSLEYLNHYVHNVKKIIPECLKLPLKLVGSAASGPK